jgi:hypothetical protein
MQHHLDGAVLEKNENGNVLQGQQQLSLKLSLQHLAILDGEVLRMRAEVGQGVWVGYAGKEYDPAMDEKTFQSTAWVSLGCGTTCIYADISLDGQDHFHSSYLQPHLPKTASFNLALRCGQGGNMPQIQFNDDGVWHNFVPQGDVSLKEGPRFPFLQLEEGGSVSGLRLDRPKATKSAGKKNCAKVDC